MTDQHHPDIAQHQRVVSTTAQDYGLPLPPELVRQLLDHHPSPPLAPAQTQFRSAQWITTTDCLSREQG